MAVKAWSHFYPRDVSLYCVDGGELKLDHVLYRGSRGDGRIALRSSRRKINSVLQITSYSYGIKIRHLIDST